jgi:hypothetical protein
MLNGVNIRIAEHYGTRRVKEPGPMVQQACVDLSLRIVTAKRVTIVRHSFPIGGGLI